MSSPENKKLSLNPLPSPSQESTQNPSLPDDLLLSCFALVSRLYYPTLSLVSKSFQSLIASPELYKARSILNRTETCLYVYLDFSPDYPNRYWYTLCKKPTQTLTNNTENKNKKSCGYVLVPVTITDSSFDSTFLAVGSNIYAIGGKKPSSNVSILDCRSHTWHEAPRMWIERRYPTASVLDGKIYVAGGCEDFESSNWMEVFDTKTQTWEHVLSPFGEMCSRNKFNTTVVEEEIYMLGEKVVAYKPKEDRWEAVGEDHHNMDILRWISPSDYCVIDNIVYCYRSDVIKYYDPKIGYWMVLKGLELSPRFAKYTRVRLVDYGGKMAVLMDYVGDISTTIYCAVISIERCNTSEIWGEVEWLGVVLTVPYYYPYSKIEAFALTL